VDLATHQSAHARDLSLPSAGASTPSCFQYRCVPVLRDDPDGLPAILIFFPILCRSRCPSACSRCTTGPGDRDRGHAIVAPPIGLCLVILCSLAKIKLTDTIGPLIPYISILIADLVIMAFWPWL